MRTITKEVYTFDELNDEAKQRAIDSERERIAADAIEWTSEDYRGSLDAFEKYFDVDVRLGDDHGNTFATADWYGRRGYTRTAYEVYENGEWRDIDLRDISGKLLQRYLRHALADLQHRKIYTKWNGEEHKERKSRIMYYTEDCSLSGLYSDYELLKPFRDYMAHPDDTTTYEDLVDAALNGFTSEWNRDCEYHYGDEYVSTELSERECEFLADGTPYC
jgi:hypothetical protein